ncbi:TPA: hypothetical protein HA235_04180 [Candidatus Woesearchaeota archaeon]|nr:hypothetical protein [uncultured archaeon]MBS3173028.1 hypothetical protein [Candidatus Woesearchaeota archaeon]AQS32937.1 hypothetical protein [uncultured archaeon]HIH31882.1 hypothetical protein [Candidatus Woesearchaeota archaeon]HIH54367.1 hypothetical protein [Candidatus Woesearchaeota archaeon]
MTTVGLNFTKINASRTGSSESIKVENNVGITNLVESGIPDQKKSLLKFQFKFMCKYEPNIGSIELEGELIEIFDKDFSTKIMEMWTKQKALHKDVTSRVLNIILGKANIEAIIISKELGLPSPIQMPKVEIKAREVKAEAASDSKEQKTAPKPENKPKKR